MKRTFRKVIRMISPIFLPLLPWTSLNWGPPRKFSYTYTEWHALTGERFRARMHKVIRSLVYENISAICVEKVLPKNLATPALIYSILSLYQKSRLAGLVGLNLQL